jgi:histidinol dehydrogenase
MLITPVKLGTDEGDAVLERILDRFQLADAECAGAVAQIIKNVAGQGDEALVDYGRRFDCPTLTIENLKVTSEELRAAYDEVDEKTLGSIKAAVERIWNFHEREMEDSWLQTRDDGTVVGRLVRPVDSAGLYVPGGTGGSTPLVSSVLMNGIPASIAGVRRRVMVTPPGKDGKVSPFLLVAAQEIGISDIYRAGSAWGIAALAWGTESIPKVDVIVGPGNQFVAEAKKQVSGMVRIDMIAGPSEVLIVADANAVPAHVAADMLAQAEHDPQALALLLTTDETLPEKVLAELEKQLPMLSREKIARTSLTERGAMMIVKDLEEAIRLANDIASEHLELDIVNPWEQIPFIRHAGAIFLGASSPEAAGDYFAGPNHVLPTMGTARFASSLGVETFLKKCSIISCSRQAIENDAEDIMRLAHLEGLDAHANSVKVRLNHD